MNKLFIDQPLLQSEYASELNEVYKKVAKNSDTKKLELSELSENYLIENSIGIVLSNGIPAKWLNTFKQLKITSVLFDRSDDYYSLADIVIDYQSDDNKKYFTGPAYSICKNPDFAVEEIINLIQVMKWDSDFFGFPIAYLSSRQLTDSIIYRIDEFIKGNKIRLIEYLCNCHDNRSVTLAEKNGFHFTDIRLTFDLTLNEKYNIEKNEFEFGLANKSHIPKLKETTANLYKDSRYSFDGNFDLKKINEFYSGWIEKAVLGTFDHECYCLFKAGLPVAFCTIRFNQTNSANIGLFGIADGYQGKGLGRQLLYAVFNELIKRNYTKLFVVTQGRNYNAQRLYQSVGFKTTSTELWYHKWMY